MHVMKDCDKHIKGMKNIFRVILYRMITEWEVLNFNERPTMRVYYVVYMHTKPVFFCFRVVLEVIFDSRILTVISLLSLKLQTLTSLNLIQDIDRVRNFKFKT